MSADGGASFAVHTPLPSPNSIMEGDAGNPAMVRDAVDGSINCLTHPVPQLQVILRWRKMARCI